MTLLDQLRLLDRHFRIRTLLERRGVPFPVTARDRFSTEDLVAFGNVSYPVRTAYPNIDFAGLTFRCAPACPRSRRGSDVLGQAAPGSKTVTICTHRFDAQVSQTRTGVVVHEAFHASFDDFNHDTYSFDANYPGGAPLTNAESYAMFASNVATGRSYRVILLPEIQITGSAPQ